MGALLSLPLLAIPSVGTVCHSSTQMSPADPFRSGLSPHHAVELQLVQQYAAHVGNFRIGRLESYYQKPH